MEQRSHLSSLGEKLPANKSGPIRVNAKTKEKIQKLLEQANAKSFGRKVKAGDVLEMSLSLMGSEQIRNLQDQSLSNADRLEILFNDASKGNPDLSKDDVIGLLLEGELRSLAKKKKHQKPWSDSSEKLSEKPSNTANQNVVAKTVR